MVMPILNIGLNLYRPDSQHFSGLYTGTVEPYSFLSRPKNMAGTDIENIRWHVWYFNISNNQVNHRLANNITVWKNWEGTGSGLHPYINSTQALPPDLAGMMYLLTHEQEPDIWRILFGPGYSNATSVLQLDSSVYGYCNDLNEQVGILPKYRFSKGSVNEIASKYTWNSFISHPVTLDPNQKMYRFYSYENMPGRLLPARMAFLESFAEDQIPFGGNYKSPPRNFKTNNYPWLMQLMNSQVSEESIDPSGSNIAVDCVEFNGSIATLDRKLESFRYHILNFKPNKSYGTGSQGLVFNFPFKPDGSTIGGHLPWSNSGDAGLTNCVCWNVVRFTTRAGNVTELGFLSNCPYVGTWANSGKFPTNKFTYSGILIKNQATNMGPGGYSMEAGEWIDFKWCPSSWHMSPSWDIICHSSQIKLGYLYRSTSIGIMGTRLFEIGRAGFSNISQDKLNAC